MLPSLRVLLLCLWSWQTVVDAITVDHSSIRVANALAERHARWRRRHALRSLGRTVAYDPEEDESLSDESLREINGMIQRSQSKMADLKAHCEPHSGEGPVASFLQLPSVADPARVEVDPAAVEADAAAVEADAAAVEADPAAVEADPAAVEASHRTADEDMRDKLEESLSAQIRRLVEQALADQHAAEGSGSSSDHDGDLQSVLEQEIARLKEELGAAPSDADQSGNLGSGSDPASAPGGQVPGELARLREKRDELHASLERARLQHAKVGRLHLEEVPEAAVAENSSPESDEETDAVLELRRAKAELAEALDLARLEKDITHLKRELSGLSSPPASRARGKVDSDCGPAATRISITVNAGPAAHAADASHAHVIESDQHESVQAASQFTDREGEEVEHGDDEGRSRVTESEESESTGRGQGSDTTHRGQETEDAAAGEGNPEIAGRSTSAGISGSEAEEATSGQGNEESESPDTPAGSLGQKTDEVASGQLSKESESPNNSDGSLGQETDEAVSADGAAAIHGQGTEEIESSHSDAAAGGSRIPASDSQEGSGAALSSSSGNPQLDPSDSAESSDETRINADSDVASMKLENEQLKQALRKSQTLARLKRTNAALKRALEASRANEARAATSDVSDEGSGGAENPASADGNEESTVVDGIAEVSSSSDSVSSSFDDDDDEVEDEDEDDDDDDSHSGSSATGEESSQEDRPALNESQTTENDHDRAIRLEVKGLEKEKVKLEEAIQAAVATARLRHEIATLRRKIQRVESGEHDSEIGNAGRDTSSDEAVTDEESLRGSEDSGDDVDPSTGHPETRSGDSGELVSSGNHDLEGTDATLEMEGDATEAEARVSSGNHDLEATDATLEIGADATEASATLEATTTGVPPVLKVPEGSSEGEADGIAAYNEQRCARALKGLVKHISLLESLKKEVETLKPTTNSHI